VLNSKQTQRHSNHFSNQHAYPHENKHENRHQIETIDEFTVARIYRLWDDWLIACLPENPRKLEFYRQVVATASGLGSIKLATVYILLARLDAARRQDAREESTQLSGAEAGPA